MSNTSKIITGIVVILLVIWGVLVSRDSQKSEVGKSGEVIKIGVVAPITGGASGYGESLVKGIELAKRDLGGTKNTYEVIYEDDGTNPAQAATAAQKLVNVDKVKAIITTTSGTGNAVKPIATAAGAVHTCICVNTQLTEGNMTNFIYLALPQIESQTWVDEAAARGVKTIAIISQNHPGVNILVDTIKSLVPEKNISVVFEERYDPATKDFKTVIAKAKIKKPDLYLVVAFPPSLDILGTELAQLGIKNVAGLGTFAIAVNPSVFEGGWFTDVKLSDTSYKNTFESAFPNIRFNARTAPEGYDVFNILVNAFENGGNIAEYMRGMDHYFGKSGNVTKEIGSGNFSIPVGIWEIREGKAVQVK